MLVVSQKGWYFTPGAGRHYFMPGDPPATRSTLRPAYPREGEGAPAPAPAARVGGAPSLASGQLHATWQTAGNRVHGIGWEGDTLWAAESKLRAFFRHDMWLWKDVGWIANFRL